MKLLLSTGNLHKYKEVKEILSPYNIELYSLRDFNLSLDGVDENGKTYKDNALIKANYLKNYVDIPIIADDSGIEIEDMDNQPGIHSARFADSFGGHINAIKYIEEQLANSKERKARFVCDIALVNLEKEPLVFEAIVNGHISNECKGKEGFGYDPIFIPNGFNKTYAELTDLEKNDVSHRGLALKKLVDYLKETKRI